MIKPAELFRKTGLHSPALITGWSHDAGKLGERVTDYLVKALGGYCCCEIEPEEFFPLGGVSIEDDLVQFPESRFYHCPQKDILIFKSTPPSFKWHSFFHEVLDIAEQRYTIREVYDIGGMVSINPHSTPRQILGTFTSAKMKYNLSSYNLHSGLDYETPEGQKPSLDSFFLWTAKKRNLAGVNLWVQIPFYLMSVDDPKAQKKVLEFFNERFKLGLDLSEFDDEIKKQNQYLSEARMEFPDIDDSILRLESNLILSEEDNLKLEKQVEEFLKAKMAR
jgi:proteasome assembly chaperone (PAC2) family protein